MNAPQPGNPPVYLDIKIGEENGMGEEGGKEGPILSIFFAEFHNTAGPRIMYQYPENYVSKDIFDAVSVYIIPKPQIQKRIITVNVLGHKILGYPNEIKNPKYVRNALIFNLCFVCDSNSRTVHYEPAVKKLSEYLETLELDNGFLSNDDSKEKMPAILKQVLEDLNGTGKCTITVSVSDKKSSSSTDFADRRMDKCDRRPSMLSERRFTLDGKSEIQERRVSMVCDQKSLDAFRGLRKASDSENKFRKSLDSSNKEGQSTSVLHLKVVGILPDPPHVLDHHVPILNSERVLSRGDHWDLTTQQVLPYIDGYSHIAKIAALADVESNLVKACVENLLYYNQVKLLPVFQYSNIYAVTSKIRKLYTCPELQEECQRAVMKSLVIPQISDIIMLYCNMTYGITVRDLCVRYEKQFLNIDERKLVQFGLLNGIIKRLHQYPVYLACDDSQLGASSRQNAVYRMCNGLHPYDEICCRLGLTYKELHEMVENDPYIQVLWK